MDPEGIATSVVEMARDERFGDIEELFAPMLREAVSAVTLEVAWTGELARVGAVRTIGTPHSEPFRPGLVKVRVPVTCESGGFDVAMSIDDDGRLNGLRLAAPDAGVWRPPRYASPKSFTEQEIELGSGPLAVRGTLTMPKGRGPRPGVVLLASGPSDRDLTTGPNKPFKDLAWGLASRGIAVLRFDKVNHTHGEAAAEQGFTMADEYLPHTLAAVGILRGHSGVDPARVFVVGHSGGGKAAPRVAAADAAIAGVVILAGDTVPLYEAAVRVARHLAASDTGQDAVESITRQAALVEDTGLSAKVPSADLLFGWPASYWLDLREYDQVGTAAALDRPILVLQGRRDYQVTVEDDLSRWQAGLRHRPDVTIRIYEADDHMFFAGSGPSTPAGYQTPQHVDPAVVADIADWLDPERRSPIARFFKR